MPFAFFDNVNKPRKCEHLLRKVHIQKWPQFVLFGLSSTFVPSKAYWGPTSSSEKGSRLRKLCFKWFVNADLFSTWWSITGMLEMKGTKRQSEMDAKPGRYEVGTYIILFISGYFLLHTKVRTSILRRNSVNHDNSIHSRFVMCSKVWYNEQFVIDPRDKTTPHDKTIWSCEARLLVMKWTKSTFEHKQIGGKGA